MMGTKHVQTPLLETVLFMATNQRIRTSVWPALCQAFRALEMAALCSRSRPRFGTVSGVQFETWFVSVLKLQIWTELGSVLS
jgi:hypothetical protein